MSFLLKSIIRAGLSIGLRRAIAQGHYEIGARAPRWLDVGSVTLPYLLMLPDRGKLIVLDIGLNNLQLK